MLAAYEQSLVITFDTPVNAFALDLSNLFTRVGIVAITFSNGDLATGLLGDPYAFNGFISSSTFASVTIGGISNDYLMVDNIRHANALAAQDAPAEETVPEPASIALFGLGCAMLASLRRRRRT